MKINYEYTKRDYKKFLIRSRRINNIVLFIIGLGIYLYFTFNKTPMWYIPIFIVLLILVIILLNLLYVFLYMKVNNMLNYNTYGKYTLELTPNKFSLTINKSKVDYKYNNIKKFRVHKNNFQIRFYHSRDNLIFEKNKFNDNDYNKAIEYFKNKIEG